MSSAEEKEVYHIQKKPKPKGKRHTVNAVGKTLTIRFKSRDEYESICSHAESQGLSINQWCVSQLLAGLRGSHGK